MPVEQKQDRPKNERTHGERPRRKVGRPRTIDAGQASLSLLLNLTRTGKATTRQELEHQSELGRAVVSDRLAMLMSLGLLREGALGPAAGGRAPRRVEFCSDAGLILLAVLDHPAIAVGLSDLSGRLLAEHHEAIELAVGPQAIVDRLATLFDWLLEDQNRPVWGIGIAVPVPVSGTPGQPFAAQVLPLQSWHDFPVVEQLAVRFRAPVYVRSDVQMMTVGEWRSGAGRGVSDMLFVKLGRNVTAGVISDGRLHKGVDGAAGLIGHSAAGAETLDAAAGADVIAREALAAARSNRSPYLAAALARDDTVGAAEVGHGAQLGDAFCMELLARAGRLIGEALAPLANLLNPSLIVIGGGVAQTGDTILAAIREAVYRQSHPLVTRDLRIVRSQMGGSAGLVGAAQVVAEELFAPQTLNQWITAGTPLAHPEFQAFLAQAEAQIRKAPARAMPPASASPKSHDV
ncbi:MAG TPA: ROK family protein [Alphaproteobacteria bacterium]|nr:ROK family protein [Alphaproteobacteria bacterium]